MGELLDALNALDKGGHASTKTAIDQAADIFREACQTVNHAVDAAREPGMPLDSISRWTRQTPLHALAVAFLIGVLSARRR